MKKFVSILLAVLVAVLAGCTGPSDAPDSPFREEDYQKLQALQFDDYRHMTISEFQNKVWRLTDTPEYRELLERFSKDEAFYQKKDSDETAWFLFYILEPLTAEKWQTRTYSGAAISDFPFPADNATLEYNYTMTILDPDRVMVKDYNDMRWNVKEALRHVLYNRTKEELQDEAHMRAELDAYIDELLPNLQTPEVGISIEYQYFPPTAERETHVDQYFDENTEQRRSQNGTKEDYRSLLALKTADYENRSLAEFNSALLEWTNENPDSMDRISEDIVWKDVQAPLTEEARSFVELTVFLSGMENGKAIQSRYAGEIICPYYGEYLTQKTAEERGMAAWCSLYYQFSYSISDAETVTVRERDRQIGGMIRAVSAFWDNTDVEKLLTMSEDDVVRELEALAVANSTAPITIAINQEQVQFECVDERPNAH